MYTLELYCYDRADGGVTVDTELPEGVSTFHKEVRLIADKGKSITNDGVKFYKSKNLQNADDIVNYYEVNDTVEEEEDV